MDKLKYILPQKIGAFYKNQKWKKEMFDKIAEYYRSLDMIDFLTYSTWDTRIVLKDGTEIFFVEASDRSRGYKFTKVIVQPEIDLSIYDAVIRHCIFAVTQCYWVDIYNDKVEFL